MKKTIKYVLGLLAVFMLFACSSPEKMSYEEGTYTASAQGNNGDVVVDVTVSKDKIEKVEIVKHNESSFMGDIAMELLANEIVEKQSVDIDIVSGASLSSDALLSATKKALIQAGADISENEKEDEDVETEIKTIDFDVEERVVYDSDGIKLSVVGRKYNSNENIIIKGVNNSGMDATLRFENAMIGDVYVGSLIGENILNGEEKEFELVMPLEDIPSLYGSDSMGTIKLNFWLYLSNVSDREYNKIDLIYKDNRELTIYDGVESFDLENEGLMLLDENDLKVELIKINDDNGRGKEIVLLVENNSELTRGVDIKEIYINDKLLDIYAYMGTTALPGQTKAIESIHLTGLDLLQNEIDEVKNIGLKLALLDETENEVGESSVINIALE